MLKLITLSHAFFPDILYFQPIKRAFLPVGSVFVEKTFYVGLGVLYVILVGYFQQMLKNLLTFFLYHTFSILLLRVVVNKSAHQLPTVAAFADVSSGDNRRTAVVHRVVWFLIFKHELTTPYILWLYPQRICPSVDYQ